MSKNGRDPQLKERWDDLILFLTDTFSDGEALDVEGVLYLIGLQEFGKPHQLFKKEDNVNLIHIGVCTILEPFGYYRFDFIDEQGWPHFELVEPLPYLKSGEQSVLIKSAIVDYFLKQGVIS
ncbi:hypothetical protein N9877_04965 [Flavobacteriaceae bacterium]|jgi:hypothetical protein|nr:hypothetical protein [Flavobacteriaceae bacterium]MBT5284001.1 hypothetical protein [Flavobacteriaceae bacterium]MBT6952998.1 hypothetical protein [Flavobacteriaceae bacterium]MDA9144521.1 hypothetical protein [Flavobacteriaceae bacterium]MDB4267414.1 hypothetical protein [Flavobacteriaceae bacterium]